MRITTRIALGLLLMAGLLVGTLSYQLSLVDRLQGINRELSHTSLEASQIAVHLVQGLDGIREFAAKASALDDEDYLRQWREWERGVEGELLRLSRVGLSGPEEEARAHIEEGWRQYEEIVASGVWTNDPAAFLEIDASLTDMRERVGEFIAVSEAIVSERVERSAAAGEEARFVAWAATGSALLLAALISGLLFLSISGPLRLLTRGTRELARGRFEHRLDPGGPAELSSLARDFNHMAARLDELEDLKRDFVSHVSHELKTPLAAIQETVEVLLDELAGPLTAKQAHLLSLSRTSTDRLAAMITNLLEISRLEAGATTYHPEIHDPVHIVRSVVEESDPLRRDRRPQIDIGSGEAPRALLCDGSRVRDVIANLIGNAVKFSPEDGVVRVALSETAGAPVSAPKGTAGRPPLDQGPFLLLSVADQGPGVPDDHKDKVFEKFHQVGRREGVRGQQGVGLGLAISRRIVEAHGGWIWVEDAPEGGADFRVLLPTTPTRWRDLPVAPQAPAPARPESSRPPRPTPARPVPRSVVLILAAGLPLAGCASPSGGREAPPPEMPPTTLPAIEVTAPPSVDARLRRANDRLAEGDWEEAALQFERVLVRSPHGERAPDALLGLALLHLIPESPLQDAERASELLFVLEERFPGTVQALYAGWARGTLEELVMAVERTEAQERRIQELNETLERLRQIDLERRPSGTPRPPPFP